jgi:nitrate/TMAO reductase-like tetraheme cytochrome c subunit
MQLVRLNRWTTVGVAIACAASIVLVATLAIIAAHPTVHPFVGVLWPLALPGLTALGVAAFAWGVYRSARGSAQGAVPSANWGERLDRIVQSTGAKRATQLALPIAVLVALPLLVTGLATLRTMHYMETPVFCGQACHVVMGPQWTAYQDSPHRGVPCAKCHIGTSLSSFVQAKKQGAYELLLVLTGTEDRPVGPPASHMPPWQETCARCHISGRDYDDRVVVRKRVRDDRANTVAYGIVNLKMGSDRPGEAHGIHWHAAADTVVEYVSDDDERDVIRWVRVTRPDGEVREYFYDDPQDGAPEERPAGLAVRRMDCYDCHNRTGHDFHALDEAVDRAVTSGRISSSIPFAASRARSTLSRACDAGERYEEVVDAEFRSPYGEGNAARHGGAEADVGVAVKELVSLHRRNVHPDMRVGWGTYPNHMGHDDRSSGCFRCHNQRMRTREGKNISQKCLLCHDVIAEDATDLSTIHVPSF